MNAPVTIFQPQHPAPDDVPVLTDEDRARAHHYALLGNLFFAAPEGPLLGALVASAHVLGSGDTAFAAAWAGLGEIAAGRGQRRGHRA
ncbi:TorD family cytoplasmic chaperone [Azoarcus sp. CIB]|uniref:hypothetical protein n=1 Tax=Aromatoleum sp. (strain CIB) TaxID=198107 RepID=UPI0006A310A7|nr:hypothetical protein [Azoarcus sp. CIB]AKU09961.1 TorD family cytoplasmic chaperone [Azoarcus sp. CIB]